MPVVAFSVPQDIYEQIQSRAIADESENLAAKRLLLGVLGVESPSPMPPDLGDRLESIESRLEKFEKHLDWAKREILDQRGKIKSLESDAYWDGDKKPETTIMIQKQPLPLAVEIQRSHEEAARDWGKTLATVKRWAKDPDKWPEGWLWDGDKNFWVKEV